MALFATVMLTFRVTSAIQNLAPPAMAIFRRAESQADIYNILWVLVFGFATLNILALVARRFESERNRLSFGEMLAVMVVLVAVALLATELLHMFKIFPIRLRSR